MKLITNFNTFINESKRTDDLYAQCRVLWAASSKETDEKKKAEIDAEADKLYKKARALAGKEAEKTTKALGVEMYQIYLDVKNNIYLMVDNISNDDIRFDIIEKFSDKIPYGYNTDSNTRPTFAEFKKMLKSGKLKLTNDITYTKDAKDERGYSTSPYTDNRPKAPESKDVMMWNDIKKKFGEIYFLEGESDNSLVSLQVKAEEYAWQFDRYSKYASSLSWPDAEAKFKKSLTPEELKSISIKYGSGEYADAEEHDQEKTYRKITVTKI